MLNIGQVILHYRITELLDRGETGVVYRAEDLTDGRSVAVKTYDWNPENDPGITARLRKEAAAVQALRHPNICRVEHIDVCDALLCVVMELVDGSSLDALICGKPLDIPALVQHAVAIASALDAAHHRAILHNDLKPSKVIVSAAGVKVVDFGVGAILKMARREGLTAVGQLLGVLSYASPERMTSRPLDSRSDLFSFGSIMYEMATGQPPFAAARAFRRARRARRPGAAALVERRHPAGAAGHHPEGARKRSRRPLPERRRRARGFAAVGRDAPGPDGCARHDRRCAAFAAGSGPRRPAHRLRALSDHPRGRAGRHGRRVFGERCRPRSAGRYQVAARARGSSGGARFLRQRSARGRPVAPSQHRDDLRRRRSRRPSLHRDGVRRGRDVRRTDSAGVAAPAGAQARDHGRGVLGAAVRAPRGRDPSRHQTVEYQGRRRWRGQGSRFRDRARERGVPQRRCPGRNDRLRRAGAAAGKADRHPRRHLRGRRGLLRAAVLSPCVHPGRGRDQCDAQRHARAARADRPVARSAVDRAGEPLSREGSGSPVPRHGGGARGSVPRPSEARDATRIAAGGAARCWRRAVGDAARAAAASSASSRSEHRHLRAAARRRGAARFPARRHGRLGAARRFPGAARSRSAGRFRVPRRGRHSSRGWKDRGEGGGEGGAEIAAEPAVLQRTLDLAAPKSVPVLTAMELVALLRLPQSPALDTLLRLEGEGALSRGVRTRDFNMEFLRGADGALKPTIVTMRVTAPDFNPPLIEKRVRVRPESDSERQTFLLTPQKRGHLRLQFDVLLDDVAFASRSLETEALASDATVVRAAPVVVTIPLKVNVPRQSPIVAVARDWRRWVWYAAVVPVVLAVPAMKLISVWNQHDADARTRAQTLANIVSSGNPFSSTRTLKPVPTPAAGPVAPHGPSYALVVGVDEYANLPTLTTAVNDATAMEAVLRTRFGFQTEILKNATRYEILTALSRYRSSLPDDANLIVYYAGHGYFDKEADKAYWLPADAQAESSANWIIADDITSAIRAIPAKHVLVIADSCYSGALTRDPGPVFTPQERDRYLSKMEAGKSRTLLSSGGNEPVSDAGGEGNHSIFAATLLNGLDAIAPEEFTAQELFANYIGISVAGRSQQTPQYAPIRNSGHDSGDFVFVRKGGR